MTKHLTPLGHRMTRIFTILLFIGLAWGQTNKVPSIQVVMDSAYKAAKNANAYDFIEKFKDEFNTVVGDNGVLLSGGQRQRIAIARAVLKNSPILLLDEATSSLDKSTEEKVMENILKLKTKITIIAIAHRTSTLSKCDRIFKFENYQLNEV